MLFVAIFIATLDVLKYFFGIDPVGEELAKIEQKKKMMKNKLPVIIRYIYVVAPPSTQSSGQANTTVSDTSV